MAKYIKSTNYRGGDLKPISIQLYTLREAAAQDFPAVLRAAADIGFEGVEFAGLHGHDPKEIKKYLDNLGLRVSSSHTALPTLENIRELVETEIALGNNWLITGFGPNDFPTVEACRVLSHKLNVAVELLRPHGMHLGYHNHWWEFGTVEGHRIYDLLLECSPNLECELDIYWAAMGGADPAAVIRQYNDKMPFIHVKDGPLEPGKPHTAVGDGKLDIPHIINAADPTDLQWLIVELDECETDMLEAVRKSYDYLTSNGLARGRK